MSSVAEPPPSTSLQPMKSGTKKSGLARPQSMRCSFSPDVPLRSPTRSSFEGESSRPMSMRNGMAKPRSSLTGQGGELARPQSMRGSFSSRSSYTSAFEIPIELSEERVKEIRDDYIALHREVSSLLFDSNTTPPLPPRPITPTPSLTRKRSEYINRGPTYSRAGSVVSDTGRSTANSHVSRDPSNHGTDPITPPKNFLESIWETIVVSVTSPIAIFNAGTPEATEEDEDSTQLGGECYSDHREEFVDDELSTIGTDEIYYNDDVGCDFDGIDRHTAVRATRSRVDSVTTSLHGKESDPTSRMATQEESNLDQTIPIPVPVAVHNGNNGHSEGFKYGRIFIDTETAKQEAVEKSSMPASMGSNGKHKVKVSEGLGSPDSVGVSRQAMRRKSLGGSSPLIIHDVFKEALNGGLNCVEKKKKKKKSKDKDKDKERTKDRDKERDKDKERTKDRDKDRDRDKERERDKDKERTKDRDKDRDRDKERERDKDKERDKEKEREKDKERDKEKDKEKDKEREKGKSREVEENIVVDKEREDRDKDTDKESEKKSDDGSTLLVELKAWRDIELEADEDFIEGLKQTRKDLKDMLDSIRTRDDNANANAEMKASK